MHRNNYQGPSASASLHRTHASAGSCYSKVNLRPAGLEGSPATVRKRMRGPGPKTKGVALARNPLFYWRPQRQAHAAPISRLRGLFATCRGRCDCRGAAKPRPGTARAASGPVMLAKRIPGTAFGLLPLGNFYTLAQAIAKKFFDNGLLFSGHQVGRGKIHVIIKARIVNT